jgi:hypothetical protein
MLTSVTIHADSDLKVTCGPAFAAFDRFTASGRSLNVVPWVEDRELTVVATVQMPTGQPHAWAIRS